MAQKKPKLQQEANEGRTLPKYIQDLCANYKMQFYVIATLLAIWQVGYAAYPAEAPLSITIKDGVVRGFVSNANPNVRQFLGIPFAKPPLGNLRFAPPQAREAFGVIDVKSITPSCPQYVASTASVYTRDVLEFNIGGKNGTGATDEDCLTLSVWTPTGKVTPGSLPVLVYIYGGGFTTGGEDVPYQIPTQWVQRTQDHVVVSFNYRLNIFGFPSAAGLPADKHNLGLMDQRLAVEWVAANIAAFGGDPKRVVIWGQSAGAASVAAYEYAYPKDPLITGLIMDSGAEGLLSGVLNTSTFTLVAQKMGCGNLGAAEELACMRRVPFKKIEAYLVASADSGASVGFSPVQDGKLVFSNYTDRALQGAIAQIPAIIGTNAQDGVAFVPWNPAGIDEAEATAIMQELFLCPAVDAVGRRKLAGLPSFRYRYAGNFSNIAPRWWEGAYHSSELPLIFGTHPNYRGKSTPLEYATSAAMQDAWVAFARQGTKGLQKVGWPVYDDSTSKGAIQVFGDGSAVYTGGAEAAESGCA